MIWLIIVLLIVAIWYTWPTSKDNVLIEYDNADMAERTLQIINDNNLRLIEHIEEKYQPDSPAGQLALRLRKNYRPNGLKENDPQDINATSYTEDKGRVLALCLRDPRTGKRRLHDQQLIEFVDLHELAHIGNTGWGHKTDFWSTFKFLLQEAQEANIYMPQNYEQQPDQYCGLEIDYNPLYDASLESCCGGSALRPVRALPQLS